MRAPRSLVWMLVVALVGLFGATGACCAHAGLPDTPVARDAAPDHPGQHLPASSDPSAVFKQSCGALCGLPPLAARQIAPREHPAEPAGFADDAAFGAASAPATPPPRG